MLLKILQNNLYQMFIVYKETPINCIDSNSLFVYSVSIKTGSRQPNRFGVKWLIGYDFYKVIEKMFQSKQRHVK